MGTIQNGTEPEQESKDVSPLALRSLGEEDSTIDEAEGQSKDGKAPWQGVRERCRKEWTMFQSRVANAEKAYFQSKGIDTSNFTSH